MGKYALFLPEESKTTIEVHDQESSLPVLNQWITTPLFLKITDHLLRILPARQEEEEESCAPKLVMDTPEYVTALQNGQASGKYGGGISF